MKLGSVQTICPTHWKSYLVVTFPNAHVKLTKSVITSSLSQVKNNHLHVHALCGKYRESEKYYFAKAK